MSKILRNPGGSDVAIIDAGTTVPAASQYTIPPQDYLVFAASSDVITLLSNSSLILNDGGNDITNLSKAVDIIKGWCPAEPTEPTDPFFFDFSDIVSGDSPVPIISYTVIPGQILHLIHLEISCRIEAFIQVQKNGEVIGSGRTGAARPSSNFHWYPNRQCVEGETVEVILTKRFGTSDISVDAHLMGITTST